MKDVSILIPSRNEMFLSRTIEDLIEHCETDFEIIAVLDGEWADPPIAQHPRVNVIYLPKSIGQRSATNLACRMAQGKYVIKCDAHCGFDQGFDKKMVAGFEKVGDNVTMVPVMRNLWAFDWKCYKCGWKTYQGPTPKKCPQCGRSHRLRRKIMWVPKHNPQSVSYCFDTDPHFQYFEEYKHREPFLTDKKTGFTETMSLQGSFFMLTRENYWKWEVCDDNAGSWGNQGIEVALATWLRGGKVLCNHNTYYGHMFRTQGGDFSFPYEQKGREVQSTKKYIKKKFWDKKFKDQKFPLSWLIRRFMPVKNWDEKIVKELEARGN